MDILLINPSINPERCFEQLGLEYLASSLKANHLSSKVYSMEGREIDQLRPLLVQPDPELVGIYCNTPLRNQVFRIASYIKGKLPKTPIVIGGPHATLMPHDLLNNPNIDFVFRGESEKSLPLFIRRLKDKKSVQDIPGLAYREDGSLRINDLDRLDNLDSLPSPTRIFKSFSQTVKFQEREYTPPILLTRGCPYACSFCSGSKIQGKGVRKRSIENMSDELSNLKERCVQTVVLIDDTISVYPKYFLTVMQMLKDLDMSWICQSRVDIYKKLDLGCMRENGCQQIEFGVESGSPKILDYFSKGNSITDVIKSFEECKRNGILSFANFIIGSPNETIGDVRMTFDLIDKIGPDSYGLWIATPYPQTGMYRDALNRGLMNYTGEELFDIMERINSEGIIGFKGYFKNSKSCFDESKRLLAKSKFKSNIFIPKNNKSFVSAV